MKSNKGESQMNENKAIALEIIKLGGGYDSDKEAALKYNVVLEILNNGTKKEEQIEELTIPKDFILRFEFGTFRVIEDLKIKVLKENVVTGGVYGGR